MATLDVTQNGVAFNEKTESQNNANALETLFHTTASEGDIIDFPFTGGDQCWIGEPDTVGIERCVQLDLDDGLPQDLTVQGRTDDNDEPVGEIIVDDGQTGTYYGLEILVRGGLTMDWNHLRFDANHTNSGQSGSGVQITNQDEDASNDITFHNCYFENGQDKNVKVLQANGCHFEYCTFDNAVTFHNIAIRQDMLTDAEATPRCSIKNCLSRNANRLGINHSPGKVLVQDSVIQNCTRGGKCGTESNGQNHDVEWIRVRVIGHDETGIHAIDEANLTSAITLEDVILDAADGNSHDGIYGGQGAWNVNVRENSEVIVIGSGDQGAEIGDNVQLDAPDATVYVFEGSNYGINYASDQTSTIGKLRTNNNGSGAVNDNGNLTIESLDGNADIVSDISGVPTTDEVGVGTADGSSEPSEQTSFDDPPYELPTSIDASHFDEGGEGVAFHEENQNREEFTFRSDLQVGIEDPSNGGTGDGSIGYVTSGEWLEYTVEAAPGEYEMLVSGASTNGGTLRVLVNGGEIGQVTRTTDGTYNFRPHYVGSFTISQDGEHVIRVEWLDGWLNLDRIIVLNSELGEYTLPSEGETDWHVPLNENFATIEEDIISVAEQVGSNVSVDLAQPQQGSSDWHVPLNENFAATDQAVQALADAAGISGVGDYTQPERGAEDWHVPLNDNFEAIETDLLEVYATQA